MNVDQITKEDCHTCRWEVANHCYALPGPVTSCRDRNNRACVHFDPEWVLGVDEAFSHRGFAVTPWDNKRNGEMLYQIGDANKLVADYEKEAQRIVDARYE